MIGKKVPNPDKSASKSVRIGRLVRYVLAPERTHTHEKCVYEGARAFVTEAPDGWAAEMAAVALEAVRSRDPVNHYILSWREGDQPTGAQVEQAVDLVLDELGLSEHQAVYGLHADTDNLHMHLVINRVHPDGGKVVKVNRGFDVESIHRAVARIVDAQGWEPEQGARYRVDAQGQVVRSSTEDRGAARQPQARVQDREHRTGEQSAERRAIEQAGPLIEGASSWAELHESLGQLGMRYERVGSGAKVWVGDVPVKASRVARGAGFGKLQKRLGAYEEAKTPEQSPAQEPAQEHTHESDQAPAQEQPSHAGQAVGVPPEYLEDRARRVHIRTTALGMLKQRHQQQRDQLAERQAEHRGRVLSQGNWKGKGALLNAIRQQLATEQRQERKGLSEQLAHERGELIKRLPPTVGLERWLRDQGRAVEAEQWRYRNSAGQAQGERPKQAGPKQGSAGDKRPASTLYERYLKDREAADGARRLVLGGLSLQQGREVAKLKATSRRRWGGVRVMSRGSFSRAVFAASAKAADQRDWDQLRSRQRTAVTQLRARYSAGSWQHWLQAQAERGDAAAIAMLSKGNKGPLAIPQKTQGGPGISVVHKVAGVSIADDGRKLSVRRTDLRGAHALLRLSQGRWGSGVLGVSGTETFRGLLVQAAAEGNYGIRFADSAMEAQRVELTKDNEHDRPESHGPRDSGRHRSDSTGRGAVSGEPGGPRRARRGAEPACRLPGALRATHTHARVRHMSEIDVAFVERGPEVLLPGDARPHLGRPQPCLDSALRRGSGRGAVSRPKGRGR